MSDQEEYKGNFKNERRSFNRTNQQISLIGKLPPQALDVEQVVLGALLLEKDAIDSVADFLRGEMFYEERHQKIFTAIMELFNNGKPVDIVTVTSKLRGAGELEMVGGAFYVTDLTNRVASGANAEYHGRIIVQKFIQRELIRISTETINDAYDDTSDVLSLLDSASGNISSLQIGVVPGKEVMIADALMDRLVYYEKIAELEITGIPSGLADLDRKMGGFQAGDLIILAARPAMGKSALALTIARNIGILLGKKVGFFSLEMPEGQLTDRLLSMESQVDLFKLRTPKLLKPDEWSSINRAAGKMSASNNIIMDDFSHLGITAFRSKARRMKKNHDIQLIIIDYLQLMNGLKGGRGNRDQEIGEISRGLKSVAKDLGIPIIALAQLSRAVESRAGGSKKPMLSDLRESGNIEQDADAVLFLHRPEYYGLMVDEDNNPTEGIGEIIVAKYRNGETGTVRCRWVSRYTMFADLDSDWNQQELVMNKPSNFIIKPSKMYNPDDDLDSPF